ncbi:MAG: glutamate racemase, partial [Proteobacteria bacterium]|nr:glutamate racemase [Pseudomonadota bacterium]
MSNLPIGVFDSGVGGLTVLKALRERMPAERYLYLGDTARLPYGTKSPDTVTRYALKAAGALVDRGIKALVVACNTASSVAIAQLTEAYAPIPVLGVVEPGARAAAEAAQRSGSNTVLVLATESTVAGGAYSRALLNINAALKIRQRTCPLLVTLAEEGRQDDRLTHLILEDYLAIERQADTTLLLGCTHFPMFRQVFTRLLDPHMQVIDSAETTANAVYELLHAAGALARHDNPGVELLATDDQARFRRGGRYFLG